MKHTLKTSEEYGLQEVQAFNLINIKFLCGYAYCERATPTSANSTLQTRIAAPLPN